MKKRVPITILTFLAGIITALPIAFPKLFVIGMVSFALPAFIEYTASGKALGYGRTYLRGLAFFMGFGIVVFSWFCALYPLEFTGLGKGAAVAVVCAGWFGLSLLQALFWALLFLVNGVLARLLKTRSNPLVYSLIFSCLYVVFEWMSTKTWAAVPWGRLAVGQTDFLPMIQISSVLGSYAVSFILVFFGCALGVGIAKYRKNGSRDSFRPLAIAAAILAVNIVFGGVRTLTYTVPDESEKVTAAVLQGNVSSHEKWSDDSYGTIKNSYAELLSDAAGEGAKIVVLPETPIVYNIDGVMRYDIKSYYERLARESGCTIVTGAFTSNEDGISENSVVVITPDEGLSEDKYVKRHLVPFGEYVPMRNFISVIFPPLSNIAMLESDLASGNEATVLDTGYGRIAPIICFDSIYETLSVDSVRAGGELLTLSTNDSWFLDSPAVWEHNRHAVLRSVECGRYLVRAANTGVSSIISPTGEIMTILPPLESGYAVEDVYMISDNTVYTVIGNAFIPICAIGALSLSLYCHFKKRVSEDE